MKDLAGLTTAYLGRCWQHHAVLTSTNTFCKQAAQQLPHGAIITAQQQTEGKGRLGRQWHDPAGKGLALSVLLKQQIPEQPTALPLVVGLSAAEAIQALCGVSCQLKWSNDLVLAQKKVGGILCESRISAHNSFAVVGIGINLQQTQKDFDRLALAYATSLALVTGKQYAPAAIAAAILNHLEPRLEQLFQEGFAPRLREQYRAVCVTLGKHVHIQHADGTQSSGTAVDIDTDGALLCASGGEIRRITAGETSLGGMCGAL